VSWIRAGGKYETADGRTAKVTRKGTIKFGIGNRQAVEAWFGKITGIDHEVAWSLSGGFDDKAAHPCNLVRPAAPKPAVAASPVKKKRRK